MGRKKTNENWLSNLYTCTKLFCSLFFGEQQFKSRK